MGGRGFSTGLVFGAACAGMMFYGVAILSLGPILGPLNGFVEGANALPATMSAGVLLGTVLFGPVVDRSGYKWLLVLSSLFALAGLQGLSIFSDIALLHCAIFFLGFGGGVLNGLTNAMVSDIYDDSQRGGRISLLGSFYCIGALLWTLLNYFVPDYRVPLNAVSIVMAAVILMFLFIQFPSAKPKENVSVAKSLGLLRYPALILFALVLFFQCVFEGASGSFVIPYLGQVGGMENSTATLAMTWFIVGMLIGRLPLGKIMCVLKELGTLFLYLGFALVGVVIFSLYGSTTLAVYGAMVLMGFGAGATFPVVLNFIGKTFRELSGTAFSIALFIGLLGLSAGTKFMGIQFDNALYSTLPITLFACVIMIMAIVSVAVWWNRR